MSPAWRELHPTSNDGQNDVKTKHYFFPLLLGIVATGWLVSRVEPGQSSERGQLHSEVLRQLRPQPHKERRWEAQPTDKLFTLESSPDVTLFGSLRLKSSSEGNFCVLDNGDFTIKCFQADGTFARTYGNGRGQGPEEFTVPTDFAVNDNGTVYVADAGNGRVLRFAPGHSAEVALKPEDRPYRLSLGQEGKLFVMPPPAKEQLFMLFDPQGEKELSFGTFLDEQMRKAQLLDGWIEPLPDGGFVYAATYAGLLAAYRPNGELRFLTETINRPDLPKLIRSGSQTWVDREAFRTTLSLSLSTHGIHVFTYYETGLKRIGVIDTYNLEDGRYLYSRRLPEQCRQVVVTADHLYTVQDTSIGKWRLEFADS